MKNSKVPPLKERRELAKKYRHAAELISVKREIFCCYALERVMATDEIFSTIFRSSSRHNRMFLYNAWMQKCTEHAYMDEVRERRIFALLWAAELIEDGEAFRIMEQQS